MNNTKQAEQKKFNPHTGTLKEKLENAGVTFSKTWDGKKWDAYFDGQPIAQHRELNVCIKEAAKALGEL